MGANAIRSHGTSVHRQDLGAGAFTAVEEVVDVTPPELQVNIFEAIAQTDEDDYYVAGMRRKGELSFTTNWNPAATTHAALLTSWAARQLDGWKVIYSNAKFELYSGYIRSITRNAPIDDKLQATVTVRPHGAHIFG